MLILYLRNVFMIESLLLFLGHPQVIKVVQSTANKALGGIVSTTNAGGLKVFKTPSQESQVLYVYKKKLDFSIILLLI